MKAIPRVVFENHHAVIIDKPIGIAHHSSDEEDGIMKTMRSLQQSDSTIYSGDLFSVHRLDRDTSGLLLFAKTKSAAAFFSKQFADRKVVKYCEYMY
jgi:23S rRNA-/tRNA-specific pseudouridylate synthase